MTSIKGADLNQIHSIHFVGIKGVAMTALAIVAKERGILVSGSDVEEEFPTDTVLRRFGIQHTVGFEPKDIPAGVSLVIYTGAHQGLNNPQVAEAIRRGIPVLPHGKALGLFMQGKKGISVAGSHGKTTTSAMIAQVLSNAKYDPSFAVGCGEILVLKTPGHLGKGDYFVAEADEFVTDPISDMTPRFMWQKPEVLVVTNIDYDHPDVYKDLNSVQKAFYAFASSLSDTATVVYNQDDPVTVKTLQSLNKPKVTYGTDAEADYRLANVSFVSGKTSFQLHHHAQDLGKFELRVPGMHNAHNAAAVVAALGSLGLSVENIRQGLSGFMGTKRRFELVSQKHGKLLYDDYAHHPAEIAATIAAARNWFPDKRLIVVFQPHTYSRTQALLSQFGQSLAMADVTLVTEIYASAREKPISGVTGEVLYREVKKKQTEAYFAPASSDVLQYLEAKSKPNDLIVTMGAGDIFTWLTDLADVL